VIETRLNYKINKFKTNFDEFLNNNIGINKDKKLTVQSFNIKIEQWVNLIDIFCTNIDETKTLFAKKKNNN